MTSSSTAQVRIGQRLSLFRQIIYASGNTTVGLAPTAASAFLGHYYFGRETAGGEKIMLMGAATFGFIWFLANALNAITDPVVGMLSDRTRSRWGRRRPWVFVGAPFFALCFYAAWTPVTDTPSLANNLLLFFSLTGFWLFFTVVVAPYLSMLPEITPYDNERVRISALMSIFGEVVAPTLGNLFPVFAGLAAAGLLFCKDGWQTVALFFALGTVVFAYLGVAFTQEVHAQEPVVDKNAMGIGRATKEFWSVFKNDVFQKYIIGVFFYRLSLSMTIFISPFVATKILGAYPPSDTDLAILKIMPGVIGEDGIPQWPNIAGYLMMCVLFGALFLFPLVGKLTSRLGKRSLFILALSWLGVVLGLIASIGLLPVVTPVLHTVFLYVLAAFPVAVAMVVIRPLLADIIDIDTERTGEHREGLYNGVEGFLLKVAAGLGPLIAGLFFTAFAGDLGVRLCGAFAGAGLLVAAIAFTQYPINK